MERIPGALGLAALAGAGGLVVEVGAVRLAAPVLGASQPVWACAIAGVLLLLAVGNELGGRWAAAGGWRRRAGWALLAAGILVAGLPWALRALLPWALELGGVGLALGVFALLAGAPALPLGALAPLLVRSCSGSLEEVGRAAGRVQAAGTAGALAGALGATFLLAPALGSWRMFALLGLALALAGGWLLGRRAAAAALLLAPLAGLAPEDPLPPWARGHARVAALESAYGRWQLVEDPAGVRWLLTDDGVTAQSYHDPAGALRVGSWPLLAGAPLLAEPAAADAPRRMLLIGLAGGTVPALALPAQPRLVIESSELDGAVVALAREQMALPRKRLRVVIGDGRQQLQAAEGGLCAVVVDAYRSAYVPPQLVSREFVALARARLAPGGVLVQNLLGAGAAGDGPLVAACAATARAVFRFVYLLDVGNGLNVLLIACDHPLELARLEARAAALPDRPLARALIRGWRRLRPAPASGGQLLTDDRAPVAWLTHRLALARMRGR